jgi:hypothetical protein
MTRTATFVLAVAVIGCGEGRDNLPREPISGKVTVDGQPLDEGTISFVSADGKGPPAGGKIENGEYSIPRRDGPVPGDHRVYIFSPKPTGQKVKDNSEPNVLRDVRAETLPSRYNAKTELKADIKAGGSNTFDFQLTGKLDPTKAALRSTAAGGRTRRKGK